jgi:hypothetical protein
MYDPFDLNDAVIRDLPHVRVTRHPPEAGSRCTYRKQFKAEGLSDADYWLERENQFLFDFAADKLRHVVELSELKRAGDGHHTPLVTLLATFDAGITIEDWLRVRPRYAHGESYAHPFKHAGLFLLLLRGCLVALREIHAHGIVHCDIKADNICLGYAPYPFRPEPGRTLRPDFEQVRLIDFAFSVTPKRPLQQPLPILPVAPYQSNLLKRSLERDQAQRGRQRPSIQGLDWRADLYSLGHMAGLIAEAGLVTPTGSGGRAAYDGAYRLVERLKGFDGGRRTATLPHDELIADIDGMLGRLGDLGAYRDFEVTGAAAESIGAVGPTPRTPLATPVMEIATADEERRERKGQGPTGVVPWPWVVGGAGIVPMVFLGWHLATQSSVGGSATPPAAPPPLACPAAMNGAESTAFTLAARELWPKLPAEPAAAAAWARLLAELKQDLGRTQPSPNGPYLKARALACLAAMEDAGDADAGKAREKFRGTYLAYRKKTAFEDWLLALDENPGSRPPEGYALWWENGKALAETGDETARRDQATLSASTMGKP